MDYISEINGIQTLKKHKKSNFFGDFSFEQMTSSSIMFGTGLASMRGVSSGFGVEFLSMFLTAISLQRLLGLNHIVHEFGTVGYNIEKNVAQSALNSELRIVRNLVNNLHIQNYITVLSGDYHETSEFHSLYCLVQETLSVFRNNPFWDEVSHYTEIQIAGMKYLYNNYNVRIKCGWTNSGNKAMDSISVADVDTLINGRRMNEFFSIPCIVSFFRRIIFLLST